jgi:predicted transcriptional regulator
VEPKHRDVVNALLQAIEEARPLAPVFPDWMTMVEVMQALHINKNQATLRLCGLIKAGKVEKRRAPRRTGLGGGTVYYYHFIGKKP